MDIPVILIKLRDYLLWFGPAYLIAIGLGAATEVARHRLLPLLPFRLNLPRARAESGRDSAISAQIPGTSAIPVASNLLLETWLRISGRRASPENVSLQLYLWASIASQSVTWVALLVTAQISWALALLRLGLGLILASLLAAVTSLILHDTPALSMQVSRIGDELLPTTPLIEWWRVLQRRFNESSNALVLAAGVGALLFGLGPGFYSALRTLFSGPLSYVSGATIGMLAPLTPGLDAPLIAALPVKGAYNGALIAMMLTVTATPWGLLREIKQALGARAIIVYLSLTLLLATAITWLFSLLLSVVDII